MNETLEKTALKEGIRIIASSEITTTEIANLLSSIDKIYNLLLTVHTIEPAEFWSRHLITYKLKEDFEDQLSEIRDFNVQRKKWNQISSSKMEDLSKELNNLYYLKGFYIINDFVSKYPSQYRLNIVRMTKNSPLKIDLLGIGEIIKQIKEFILEIYDRKNSKKDKELQRLNAYEQIRLSRLENVEKILSISKDFGIPYDVLSEIMNDMNDANNQIEMLITQKKIEKIDFISEEEINE